MLVFNCLLIDLPFLDYKECAVIIYNAEIVLLCEVNISAQTTFLVFQDFCDEFCVPLAVFAEM